MLVFGDDQDDYDVPYATMAIIGVCTILYLPQLIWPVRGILFEAKLSLVPAILTGHLPADSPLAGLGLGHVRAVMTLFTSAFIHSSFFHLAGNMLFLWPFGKRLEYVLGPALYLTFIAGMAILVNLVWVLSQPRLVALGMGASGFIAALMGAYLALFPLGMLKALVWWRGPHVIRVPALLYVGAWIIWQILTSVHVVDGPNNVNYIAHITGFFAGAIIARVFFFLGAVISYE